MSSQLWAHFAQKWKCHEYQKKAVKFLLSNGAAALFLDPGLGKTSIVLAALKALKRTEPESKTLVIAPLRVCHAVWPVEAKKWTDFDGLRVAVMHGKHKAEALKSDADIYVINPEGLDWLIGTATTKSATGKETLAMSSSVWASYGFTNLVVDELSLFKHIKSMRFKKLKLVLKTFRRRWGLTGSPAANGLLDLFGQCYVLDLGRSLGSYITGYRQKYFTQGYDGFSWNLRPGAEREIYARIKPLALRMSSADYLDMPALIENTLYVDLPPPVRKVYKDMEDTMVARIVNEEIVAANAAVASSKCRQIVSGAVYSDDGTSYSELHTEKIVVLQDLVRELQGQPLLVAYEFKHELDRLQKAFPGAPHIGGGVTGKALADIVAAWNAKQIPVLFGHPQAMGHGLNLQGAGNHVAWYSPTWNYELYDQFIRRVYRQGNEHEHVFVHHILARDTIDDVVMGALRAKHRDQNALFNALKAMVRKKHACKVAGKETV